VEFGIPCFVLFDGDRQLEATEEAEKNIKMNRAILELFGCEGDYPDGSVKDLYLGFEEKFENNLGFETSKKGLDLFLEVKDQIREVSDIPLWVIEVAHKLSSLPEKPETVLRTRRIGTRVS